MSKLNCSIGDLAITVKANLPANLDNIVRIIGSQGLQDWVGEGTKRPEKSDEFNYIGKIKN